MADRHTKGPTRRDVAGLGGRAAALALTGATMPGRDGALSDASDNAVVDVTAAPFLARGDGRSDDAPAIRAAVASLPASGGVVRLPGPRIYRLERTVDDDGRPVVFEIGHAQVIGPARGPLFELGTSGSAILGAGPGGTILRLSAPAERPVAPAYSATVRDGRVVAVHARTAGAALATTPLIEVGDSPTGDGAALVATVAGGQVVRSDVVAPGRGYAAAPNIGMVGGGECAVRIREANHCRLAGFTLDMADIPHAVGIAQHGGWYADMARIDISEARQHATAVALLVDSHTLDGPGANGTYGGAYVSRYTQIVAKRTFVVGHDSSTATTLHFDTLDAANLHLHGVIAVLLTNVVLQGGSGAFLDLVNVDGVSMLGGDVEGPATLVRARGVCNNVRLAPLAYSATGPVVQGPVGSGWRLDLARSNAGVEALQTGNGGSMGTAYQNAGWIEKHRLGMPYAGDSMVWSSNLRMTGPHEGVLDNPANPGFALVMTISGQLIVRFAPPGSARTTLRDVAMFDGSGLVLPGLPATRPPAGSGRLWFDPADGHRVKFQP